MTVAEQAAWETLVERAISQRPSLAASIAYQERLHGIGIDSIVETWKLKADRRMLGEYDAVLAANADLLRLRGQEG